MCSTCTLGSSVFDSKRKNTVLECNACDGLFCPKCVTTSAYLDVHCDECKVRDQVCPLECSLAAKCPCGTEILCKRHDGKCSTCLLIGIAKARKCRKCGRNENEIHLEAECYYTECRLCGYWSGGRKYKNHPEIYGVRFEGDGVCSDDEESDSTEEFYD